MSQFLDRVRELAVHNEVRISAHGYEELAADSIQAREVLEGLKDAVLVEDYPNHPRGPCALVLQKDREGLPIHVVWGIPRGHSAPAVLVTAYRPNPEMWESDYIRRRS